MINFLAKLSTSKHKIIQDSGKEVSEWTYASLAEEVEVIVKNLNNIGIKAGDCIGILANNSREWILLDISLIHIGCVSVCFPPEQFSSFSADELIDKYQLACLFTDIAKYEEHSSVANIAKIGNSESEFPRLSGYNNDLNPDVMSIVFSSGSTGYLKELLISKDGTRALIERFGKMLNFQNDDSIICFLPFSIFQQRWMYLLAFYYGFDFILTNKLRVLNTLKKCQPTIIAAPPVFYDAVFNKFLKNKKSERMFVNMVSTLIDLFSLNKRQAKILKQKVFATVHELFGGNIRVMLVGAAPSRINMLKFYNRIGLPLYEGYGMTETGYISLNSEDNNKIGTQGKLLYKDSITIADDGEIIFKLDKPLCLGYLGDETVGKETFLPDNQVATGDIGHIDDDGYFVLSGRKKTIIMTPGGVKIHPEIIESKIERLIDIKRAVVFGEDNSTNLNALLSVSSLTEEVKKKVQKHINSLNKLAPDSHRISNIAYTDIDFSPENSLLNRNLKIDRTAAVRFYLQLQDY
jgi:long-subunit acyl-CoA synthetase (AMP-forming)